MSMGYWVSVPIATAALLVLPMVLATARFIIRHRKGDPRVWERAIRRFEKDDRLRFPPEGVIVFTGSSSIRFWKSLQTDMAPLPVVNRGFGGAQIHDVTHYVRRIVTPYKPKAVVFYAGENDLAGMLLSERKTPEEILAAFGNFCREVHRDLPQVPIYFIAVKPPKLRLKHWPAMQRANQLVEEYCASDARLHFIDIVPASLDQYANPRLDVFKWDGVHLNEKGYAIWTSVIKSALIKLDPQGL
jgi:lysophospholipase L1-like esterase